MLAGLAGGFTTSPFIGRAVEVGRLDLTPETEGYGTTHVTDIPAAGHTVAKES